MDAKSDSYPAQLQNLLGDRFDVRNFGIGGATLIRTGRPNAWQKLDAVKAFQPNVVIIALGTNDTVAGKRNWSRLEVLTAPGGARDTITINENGVAVHSVAARLPFSRPGRYELRVFANGQTCVLPFTVELRSPTVVH